MSELSHQAAYRMIHQSQLNEAERTRLRGHLQKCEACRQHASAAGMLALAFALEPQSRVPSARFRAAFMESASRRSRRSRIMKPVHAAGALAALALIVLAGWFIFRANSQTLTLDPLPDQPPALATPQVVVIAGTADEQLLEAVTERDAAAVRHLLADGADPNTIGSDGSSLLALAAQDDQLEIVKHLLDAGANVNGTLQVGSGSSPGIDQPALVEAALLNHADIVELLIAYGADVNETDANYGRTALFGAARYNHHEILRILLANGADPEISATDIDEYTALHLAALSGSTEAVQALLEGGADADSKTSLDLTPLMIAIRARRGTNQTDIAVLLLENGANPDQQDMLGNSALHYAVSERSTDMIPILVAHGASIDLPNKVGDTPLHIAAQQNMAPAVSILLEQGASADIANNSGETAVDLTTSDTIRETLLGTAAGANAADETPAAAAPQERSNTVIIPAPSLSGSLLGIEENIVTVYLPPSYDASEQRYPVFYALPGGYGLASLEDYYYAVAGAANLKMKSGEVAEMIVVVPNQYNLANWPTYFGDSALNGDWPSFVARDLVDYIDANYRTLAAPASRGLFGETGSGSAALDLAMNHPDIFGALYLQEPFLFAPGAFSESRYASTSAQHDILNLLDSLNALSREEAHQLLLRADPLDLMTWEGEDTMSYGLDRAADPELHPPYFAYAYVDSDVPAAEEVWAQWEAGFGNIAARVAAGQDDLQRLGAIAISEAEDESANPWATDGLRHLSEELTRAGVAHEMQSFEGTSWLFADPFGELVLPFFAEHLVSEP